MQLRIRFNPVGMGLAMIIPFLLNLPGTSGPKTTHRDRGPAAAYSVLPPILARPHAMQFSDHDATPLSDYATQFLNRWRRQSPWSPITSDLTDVWLSASNRSCTNASDFRRHSSNPSRQGLGEGGDQRLGGRRSRRYDCARLMPVACAT